MMLTLKHSSIDGTEYAHVGHYKLVRLGTFRNVPDLFLVLDTQLPTQEQILGSFRKQEEAEAFIESELAA